MMYRIKQTAIKLLSVTRAINLFWKRLPNGVYIFNYHRIGNAQACDFDQAVFSCSTEAFEHHLQILKNNFTIIDTVQLSKIVEKNSEPDKRYALITFDDGYMDNYTEAFPLLKKYNLPAVFYIPTDYIETNCVPWWDEIAFLLRHSLGQSYTLLGTELTFSLQEANINQTIQRLITAAKQLKNHSMDEVVNDMRKHFQDAYHKLEDNPPQLFMNWQQINELADNGMEIGSHTMSHRILSQLSAQEQSVEITNSKTIIEEKINRTINSIAYPVGRSYCYNQDSFLFSEQAGYKIAFNHEPGQNRSIANCFDINRYCVSNEDFDRVKFECCFSS